MKCKENILKSILLLVILFSFSTCKKPCNLDYAVGELVQIPVQFNGFTLAEIDAIHVYRINLTNTNMVDSFRMSDILWGNSARSTNEIITDKKPGNVIGNYGDYESYFDNSTLIFDWQSGRDTIANIEIKKSQKIVSGCYKNDANIQIDKLEFTHKDIIISKNQSIQIIK